MSESYLIPGQFPVQGYMLSCSKCGRKILVEIALFGVSHNANVTTICAACMVVEGEFARDYPDIAQQLTEWAGAVKGETTMAGAHNEFRAVISEATDKTSGREPPEPFKGPVARRHAAQFVLETLGPYPNPNQPWSLVGKKVTVIIED